MTQTFTINGQPVTVTLPDPVAAPSPTDTPADAVTVAPSEVPSS
jgi:hypothetical protein